MHVCVRVCMCVVYVFIVVFIRFALALHIRADVVDFVCLFTRNVSQSLMHSLMHLRR